MAIWILFLLRMDVITHTLTPEQFTIAFGVCLHSVHLDGAIIHSVLYLHGSNFKARPKPISGRTSYFQARLEFLRYSQVITAYCIIRVFGPPVGVTQPSTCSWLDHSVSGLLHHTKSPYSDSLSLRLHFFSLTSHYTITRRFILQKARSHPLTGSNFL